MKRPRVTPSDVAAGRKLGLAPQTITKARLLTEWLDDLYVNGERRDAEPRGILHEEPE